MASSIPRERTVYRRSTGKPPYHLVKINESIPSPLPPTSVLIHVHAVSLNFRDANILNGTNPWSVIEGGIACSDAAGEVVAIGSNTTRFTIGDKVIPALDQGLITGEEQTRCWLGGDVDGTLATHFLVEEQDCVKFPEHLSYAEATCLPNAGLTAWSAIISEERRLTAGQTVLLQGTGGVSLMALKLALVAGCRVIITSSSDQKLNMVKQLAGDKEVLTINYSTTADWDQEAIRLNGGIGVDIVLENGGTSSLMRSFRATKRRGIVSQVGYLGKQDPTDLDGLLPLLIDKTITYRGICVGSRLDLEQMNKVIDATKLRLTDVIDRRFSFEEAEDAIKYLWSGKHVGKVVIDID